MKKKTFTFALALLTAASAWAQTFTIGELTYNVTDLTNKEVAVSDCAETATNITIPTEVHYNNVYYDVTSIGYSAFYNCSALTQVTIPNSVISIEEYAFRYCSVLRQVTIGNRVTSIKNNAFEDCEALTAVYYNGDVEGWCKITFQTSGNQSTNPLYYAHNLYINNTLLTELIIPEGVSEIKKYAFCNCTSITKVTIPNSVTNIGSNAFAFCSSITQLSIGDGVQTIDNSAFFTCSSLEQVTLGNQITEIGQNAFNNCSKIVAVNYTGDIAKWCSINFYDYSSNPLYCARNLYINNTLLTKLTIPDDITEIKNFAFYNCDALTQVTIPNSVTNIGESAFNDCDGLTEITIPNNVTNISEKAFYDCSALTQITIGSSVKSIGKSAFSYCSALTSVHSQATTAPTLNSSYNPFFSTSFDLVFIPANSTESYIEKWGNGYTYIEEGSDTELSVHVETPGGLAAAVIVAGSTPAKVTRLKVTGTLNDDDFDILKTYMTKLYSLDLSGIANTTLPDKAFQDKAALIDIKLPANLTAIPDYAFDACKFTSIDIPNSVVSIGNCAFYECTSLKEVSLSDNLTSIGIRAFYDCSALGSITIPGNVISMKDYSFYGCDALKQVNIEDIGKWCAITFSSASANPLYYVNSFYVDNQLVTDLVIPDNVTSVSKYAFTNATNLESVTFGSHVENIAYDAFQNCTNINKLTCLSTEPPVVSGTAFTTINPKICQLEVPATAVMDYITEPVWSTFENMSFITVGEATHLLNLHIGQDGRIIYEDNSYSNGHILEVPASTPFTLQISAPAGYILESANYNETDYTAQVSDNGTLTLPALTDDATLQVNFSQQSYTIAYYVAGSNAYYFTTTTYGETFRCHAAATEGHTIQSVTLNGIDITNQLGEDGLLEITNITENCTLIISTDAGQTTEAADTQQDVAAFRAWQSNGEVFVEHTQDMTGVALYDVNGRLLHQTETDGYGVLRMAAPGKIHIVRATYADGTTASQKVM